MPTLPPFQLDLNYVFVPPGLVRITDAGTALLLSVLIQEKEKAERDAYPVTDAEHPHDAARWKAALGWTTSYYSGRFTAAKKLGAITWRTAGGVRYVKVDVGAIQAKVG